jgi:cell division protein FtsA
VKNNCLYALDIGGSKISAVASRLSNKRITGIWFATQPAKGFKQGAIVDPIDLVNAVSSILGRLKEESGLSPRNISLNISGSDIVAKHSRGIIPLAERGNKVVTRSDIEKVNEQARILGSSLEEEIIHQIPSSYTIDSKCNILNPLGLYSHRLEVDLYLVCGRLSSVQNLNRIINQAGYELKDLFFSGLATSEIVFTSSDGLKKGVNILCDLGSDSSEIAVFADGRLKEIRVLPLGGTDLSEQLAQELKLPLELAEEIKKSHGSVGDYSQINEDKEILVKKSSLYRPIKQKIVAQILTQKTHSLAQAIKGSLEEMLPLANIQNFVVVGRTIQLEGFLELLESNLGIPVKPGRINHPDISSLVAQQQGFCGSHYLDYLTALGILCLALRKNNPEVLSDSPVTPHLFARMVERIKEVYLEYF